MTRGIQNAYTLYTARQMTDDDKSAAKEKNDETLRVGQHVVVV